MKNLRHLSAALGAASLMTLAAGAAVADYPERPIDWIVMWSAGGGADTATRTFTPYFEEQLGTTVNVQNLTGASGLTGYITAKNSRPDGYTLVSALSDLPKYRPLDQGDVTVEDFEIIGGFAVEAPIIVTQADSPWDSVNDFVEDARANPGQYSVGVSNLGGVHHQPLVLWFDQVGIDVSVVAHAGSPQMNAALMGGHVDLISSWVAQSLPGVRGGELKYLASFGPASPPGFEDVPTFAEEGIDVTWPHSYGLAAPKGTPQDVLDTLADALQAVVENPDFEQDLNELGLLLHPATGEEYRQELMETESKMGVVVDLLNN